MLRRLGLARRGHRPRTPVHRRTRDRECAHMACMEGRLGVQSDQRQDVVFAPVMRPRDAMEGLVNAIRLGAWVCGVILLASAPAFAAPCTVPATCSEWVNVAQSSARLLIYRSFPLAVKNPDVTRALVVIHGAGRDRSEEHTS